MADAIEDYWEAEIAEMQLQKNYFDRLEDKIDPVKAFQFFMMEDAVQTRIHELRVVEVMPMIIEIERMPGRNYGNNIPGDTSMMYRDTMNNMNRNNINNQNITRDSTGTMNRNNNYQNNNTGNLNNQNTTRNNNSITRDTTGTMNQNNNYQNNNTGNLNNQNTTRNNNTTTRDTTGNVNRTNINNDTTGDLTTNTPTSANRMNNTTNTTNTSTTATAANYTAITDFGSWYTSEGAAIGSVEADLSHQDIYNGLTRLMTAIESIATVSNTQIADIQSKRRQIMSLLGNLQQNRLTDKHSDEAREAFMMTANMINTLQRKTNTGAEAAQAATAAAQNINTNELLIRQLDAVNDFFRHAQTAVNAMAQEVQWTDNDRN